MPGVHLARQARGFTLIEVLIAMSIMAIIAVMSWQGVDGAVSGTDGGSVVMRLIAAPVGRGGRRADRR